MRFTPVQLFLILLLGLFLLRESRQAPAEVVDQKFVSWLAANTPHRSGESQLTLIEINESSLQGGHGWPWSPLDFALFLQAAVPLQPRGLAIESILRWNNEARASGQQGRVNPQYEVILRDQVLQAPRVLLGARLGYPDDPKVIPPLEDVPNLPHVIGDPRSLPEFTAVDEKPEEKFRLSALVGFVNLPQLPGQALQRVPLLFRYRGETVPSFTLEAIMLWLRATPEDVNVELGERIWIANKITIPIARDGSILVDFSAPYVRYGYDDLLLASQQIGAGRVPIVPREAIKDRLLLLARTDPVSRSIELANGLRASSGEVFAAAIATIQSSNYIERASWVIDLAIIAAVMAITPACMRRRFSTLLIGLVVLFIGYLFLCLVIFDALLIWLPVLLPGGLLIGVALSHLFTRRTA